MDDVGGPRARAQTPDKHASARQPRVATREAHGVVRDIQSRCQRIMNTQPPPFGNANEWMAAAADSGYPLALANTAMNKALRGRNDPVPEKASS
jgi:hypothetical protein